MLSRLKYYFAKAQRVLLRRPAVCRSKIHKKAKVCSGSQINATELGAYSYIGHDCFSVNATVGAFCSIADGCRIGGAAHAVAHVSQSPVFEKGKNVLKTHFAELDRIAVPTTVIGNDVWIGAGAIFDITHALSNFFFGFLILPLTTLMNRLLKRTS